MASHVPNAVMTRDNRVQRITVSLPTPTEAISMYHRAGGRISDGAPFGEDPLQGDSNKCTRQQAFTDTFLRLNQYFTDWLIQTLLISEEP